MPRDIQDVHCGQLQFVTEASPASGKYKRISIPHLENRHCLGYLEGPAASLTTATRNDRKYITRLWKRVEESDDFLEGMDCAVIVGELDHPPERVDYSLSNGAVILTDWEIREDEGILWARFAILDTPEGRKIVAYSKFGTKLGVSSRGLGDEVIIDGETCIDPDTYEFYCFDVVAFPAVKSARQTFISDTTTESTVRKDKFATVVCEQVSKASSKDELHTLMSVIESTNVSNKDSLVEAITYKLSSLSESTDDQSNTGEEVPEDSDEKQVLLGSIAEQNVTINQLKTELNNANDLLKRRGRNAGYFRRVVQEQQKEIESLNVAIEDCLQSSSEMSTQLEEKTREAELASEEISKVELALKESSQEAAIYKKRVERKLSTLETELDRNREDLAAANKQLIVKSNAVIALENRCNELVTEARKLEGALASEDAQNKSALRESREALSYKNDTIKALEAEIVNLKEKVQKLEAENTSAKSQLHESVSKANENQKSTATVLNGYLRKSCEATGLDLKSVRDSLPATFTMSDVDRAVSEAADRRDRISMLPFTSSPRQGRIVEHTGSHDADVSSSFVVEALKRGQ